MSKLEQKTLKLNLDVSELNEQQIRNMKGIINMLSHVMSTDEEGDFFDSSSELMRMVAQAVKKSNFTQYFSENKNIEYGTQALEFCVDMLSDQVYSDSVEKYDN